MNATLDTVDGRPVLRMERRLAHPPEKVWRAIHEPASRPVVSREARKRGKK